MSLTSCPECGKETSSLAKSCAHCGHQFKKEFSWLRVIIALAIILGILWIFVFLLLPLLLPPDRLR